MGDFTLVVNSGRTGSSYLANVLQNNCDQRVHIFHEKLHVFEAKPALFNRVYDDERYAAVINDKNIKRALSLWDECLVDGDVVECGWTSAHLLPVYSRYFGDRFRYIILHRNPANSVFSHASMGFYHPWSSYHPAYKISPDDLYSLMPHKKDVWDDMNHIEKTFLWWYQLYSEAFEFRAKFPSVPHIEIRSEDLYSHAAFPRIEEFFNITIESALPEDARSKNSVLKSALQQCGMVGGEWRAIYKHPEAIQLAEKMGHDMTPEVIELVADKYRVPGDLASQILNRTRYWYFYNWLAIKLGRRRGWNFN